MLQLPLDIQLDDTARLDNFYIGDNKQLFQRLYQIITSQAELFFIWGAESSGKSHLAQAICRELSENGQIAAYIPLDNSHLKPEILEGMEFADLVCLDGIETVIGKQLWEEAIFDLFNRIKEAGKNLVIFSQAPISNMTLQLADLKSRLTSMEVYKLNSIGSDSQAEFIISIAKYRGLEVSQEVANFLLARTERDASKLLEIVTLLDRQSLAHQRKITIPFVKDILKL